MAGVLERLAREVAAVVALAVGVAGCATTTPSPPCAKVEIIVAQKEERTRLEERRTPRVTATGAVEDTTELVRVLEYRVRDAAGTWHPITEREFEVATPGQSLEVCR